MIYDNGLLCVWAFYISPCHISHWYVILDSTCLLDLVHQLSLKSLSTRIINTSNFKTQEDYEDALVKHKPDGVIVLGTSDTITNLLLKVCNNYIAHMLTYVKQNDITIFHNCPWEWVSEGVFFNTHWNKNMNNKTVNNFVMRIRTLTTTWITFLRQLPFLLSTPLLF